MGKIQDAITKVRRDREAAGAASGDGASLHPDQSVAPGPDREDDSRNRSYKGPEIVIDRAGMIEAGLLDPYHARKHLASEYRQIKRSIIAHTGDGDAAGPSRANLLMVTSATRGEGRSFVCLNLAMSLAADAGLSVVLVDADIDNPRLSTALGVNSARGLLDLLEDPSLDVRQLVSPTDVPGLAVLAGGQHREGAVGMLSSETATEVFDRLAAADPRRIFVFDSPPLLASEWSQALAKQAGQVLFVVQAGTTRRKRVLEALERLDRQRPTGVVLNRVID